MPRLLANIKRFIGKSTERKPTDCPDGSTFLETETGDMYVFSAEESIWHLKNEANTAVRLETIRRSDAMLDELKKVNANLLLVIESLGG
jgi:hypothetical protein